MMNIEAKPWYPVFETQYSTMTEEHEVAAVRRHDPYGRLEGSTPTTPEDLYEGTRYEGTYDYTVDVFGEAALVEAAPPTYTEFVTVSSVSSQPYRTGSGPYRTGGAVADVVPLPCAPSQDFDSQRHGSGCGVSACGSNESGGTPRSTPAATATKTKEVVPPKPVAIPLPRSRRPAESPTSSTQSPLPSHTPTAQEEKEHLSWCTTDEVETPSSAVASPTVASPAIVSPTSPNPPSISSVVVSPSAAPPPHTTTSAVDQASINALNEETNLFIRTALLNMVRANPALSVRHSSLTAQAQQPAAPMTVPAPQPKSVAPVPKTETVVPTGAPQRLAQPAPKKAVPVKAATPPTTPPPPAPPAVEVKKVTPEAPEKKVAEKKKKRKTEDEWHLVAGSHATKSHTTTPPPALPTPTATGFEALNKFETKKQKNKKQPVSEDEAECQVIVMAATESKKKKRKTATKQHSDDDDELLEAASKHAEGISREADEKQKQMAKLLNTPFFLFSAISLQGLPNYFGLLPPNPTQAHFNVLNSFYKLRETECDTHHTRAFALDRCAGAVSTIASSCPLLACVILAECCDTFSDVDVCNTHAAHSLDIAKQHRLPLGELIAQLAISRLFVKLGDLPDTHKNLTNALKLAFDQQEENAIGWLALSVGASTDVYGNSSDTFFWYEVAASVGRRLNDARLTAHALSYMGLAAASVGHFATAKPYVQQAMDMLQSAHSSTHQMQYYWQNISQTFTQMGDLESALPFYVKEREWFAKDMLAATATQNMVILYRGMGNYAAGVPLIQELLQGDANQREYDLLLSLACCYRDLQQTTRCQEALQRVLRGCRDVRGSSLTIRSLAELADLDNAAKNPAEAMSRLVEALRILDTLNPAERPSFCESEWRVLEVLEDMLIDTQPLDALRCSDPTRYPNTADAGGLLLRRQFKALPQTVRTKPVVLSKPKQKPEVVTKAMLDYRFFDKTLFEEMMCDKGLGGGFDSMITYSLRWNDGVAFYAYVVAAGAVDTERKVHVCRLHLTPAAQGALGADSALMQMLHPARFDEDGGMIPLDTPLFPQSHMYEQYMLPQRDPELYQRLHTDLSFCLEALHECFLKPLQELLPPSGSTLLFVGDGIINCIPFHALRCQQSGKYVAEEYNVAKVPSVQHALSIYSRRRAAVEKETDTKAPSAVNVITAAQDSDLVRQSLVTSLQGLFESVLVAEVADVDEGRKPFPPTADGPLLHRGRELIARFCFVPPRNIALSNTLFRALHLDAHRGVPLVLDVAQTADMKEDFSGMLCTAAHRNPLTTSAEVSATWDLSRFPIVACSRFGNFGTRAVHETSIPMYRALLLAGAQRLLLPCGNRVRLSEGGPEDLATVAAQGILERVLGAAETTTAQVLSEAMRQQMAQGRSVDQWAFAFALHGLP